MNKIRATLKNPRIRRYLLVGVSVYVLELLVIVTAQWRGASSVMAVGLSYWTGLVVSFGLQKMVTFGDKRLHHRVVLRQVFLTALLLLFNFGFTIVLTNMLSGILPAVLCRTLALGVTTIWNFYLYKTHIFGQVAKKHPGRTRTGKRLRNLRKTIIRAYRHWRNTPDIKHWRTLGNQRRFGRFYLVFCLAVLLATTLLWSLLGAHLQQVNADQLANAALFENSAVFHGAAFPEQHTFLVKWPLFYLVKVFSYSAASYIALTVLCVLATVGSFVYLLSRIERRPLALGTLCLLLASALLLVPAQPYAGGLLPVNMAMLTTRNIEYILYILSLVWLIRAPRLLSRQFAAATVLLALLAASDKLFLPVSIGGALLALAIYALTQRWQLVTLSARWLVAGLAAAAGSLVAAAFVNQAHITHFAGKTLAGPYTAAHDAHTVGLGILYGVGGILTNFGANPAYNALTVREIPVSILHNMLGPAGPGYLVNLALAVSVIVMGGIFFYRTLGGKQSDQAFIAPAAQLITLMMWASLAVAGLFVATNHYYQVDSRYLTLWFFTGFMILAYWLRSRRFDAELVIFSLPLLLVVMAWGSVSSIQTYASQYHAYGSVAERSTRVAVALRSHHSDVLIGDYWRVLPVKALFSGQRQTVLPLESCVRPRSGLTSQVWARDFDKRRVAYLLSLDSGLTGYPACDLQQIIASYGLPNNSQLISGTLSHPKELLLFYDQGVHAARQPASVPPTAAAILPIALVDVPRTICAVPTIMNIVAHQDDDLLFLSPDLQHDISAGNCIRSVYLTAGDAGGSQQYWLSREQGSEAAYATMLGHAQTWIHRVVALPGGQFVTIASPAGNDHISLIFMHLPDGNLKGQGFRSSHHQSIAELEAGKIAELQTVDQQSRYTAPQLTEALIALLHTYQPAEIRTQSSMQGQVYTDHSDHAATGRFTTRAHDQYQIRQFAGYVQVPLRFYVGYPIHELEPNVGPEDLALKQAAFMAYAHFDGSVCRRAEGPCQESDVYDAYLARQYQSPY